MVKYPTDEELAEMVRQLTRARLDNYLGHQFGTWRWWILVALLIVPWFIWYKLADKKKIVELVMFGLIVMVFTITLDELGFELSLWNYPYEVFPMFPRLTSIDYTVLPIIFTLVYQYFPTWKSFFRALAVVAFVFAFVIEPFLVYLNFYVLIKWMYWYSFVVYLIMGLISKWMAQLFIDILRKSKME